MLCRNSLILALFIVIGSAVRADEIWVKGEAKSIKGDVKSETAREVTVQVGKEKKTFAGADVLDIQYESVKPNALILPGGEYKLAKAAEKEAKETGDAGKAKAMKKAIDYYEATIKAMEKHPYANRHFKYRIAVLTLQRATADGLTTDSAHAKLEKYKTDNPNSWQINHVMPMIAQLQIDAKDFRGAEQTYQEMADLDVLPDDVRSDAKLMIIQILVDSGNIDKANSKLEALAKTGGNPAFVSRLKMERARILVTQKKIEEAIPMLNQVIKDNNDKQVKAMAHNTLGECLFKSNRYDEALWEFLWVDTVYNQDRNQRAKALYYLWKTFEQLNKADRAQECRELLLDAQYSGTDYQIRAKIK
jgi:predicted negative regulator of RcsB-dependent stress response